MYHEVRSITRINGSAWDAIARVRSARLRPGADFAAGIGNFDPAKLPIPEWAGKRVLHLQCASGEDTLTLALAGAVVTGVDISAVEIEDATAKAAEAGLEAEFIAADVYELPPDVAAGGFDVVFTGWGAVCWLPDLDAWAKTIERALCPGGRLLLIEGHPVSSCLSVDGGRLVQNGTDYFSRGEPVVYPAGPARFESMRGTNTVMPETHEFNWPIGDVVTAIARAGLRIELLHEEWDPDCGDGLTPDVVAQVRKLPTDYTVIARKEPSE